jgi:excisionase family DNA binding protein
MEGLWYRMSMDHFITLREAAELLGVSVSTVRRYFDSGRISGVVDPATGRRRPTQGSVERLVREINSGPLEGLGFGDWDE